MTEIILVAKIQKKIMLKFQNENEEKTEFCKEAGPEFSSAGDPPGGCQHTILPNIPKQLHTIENILRGESWHLARQRNIPGLLSENKKPLVQLSSGSFLVLQLLE